MSKNFPEWNSQKTALHTEKVRPFFHEREVWFVSLGVNIGFEQDGKGEDFLRPIVVLKKFNNETLWGVPLTTKKKFGKYHMTLSHGKRMSTAILSQLRLIDCKRLKHKTSQISVEDFVELKKRIIGLIL